MEATPVRIDAPAESDVRAVVAGEDGLGAVFVDLELSRRWLAEELAMLAQVGVRRVPTVGVRATTPCAKERRLRLRCRLRWPLWLVMGGNGSARPVWRSANGWVRIVSVKAGQSPEAATRCDTLTITTSTTGTSSSCTTSSLMCWRRRRKARAQPP